MSWAWWFGSQARIRGEAGPSEACGAGGAWRGAMRSALFRLHKVAGYAAGTAGCASVPIRRLT